MRRRSIVREPLFEETLAALIREGVAADEFTRAAESVLALDAEIGFPAKDDVWSLPMRPIDGKTVYLYYTFDDTTVYFLAIASLDD